MMSFLTLIRREFLEHRGAFLYAPLVLLALFVAFLASALASHHVDIVLNIAAGAPGKVFDIGYLAVAALWWFYLAMLLFFYFADAYHADTRNNAMLFWKSMPQGDFTILMSKLAAGLTIFPALIFGMALLSGLVVGAAMLVLPYVIGGFAVPDIPELLQHWLEVSATLLGYLVLALLWYMPFLAWVGALSTLVGRWSIPLALLIPVGVSLFEGVFDFSTAPGGSYVLAFLRQRIDFRYDSEALLMAFFSPAPLDAGDTIRRLAVAVDWPQVAAGLVFALLVIYLASLYRKRVIKG